MNFAYYNEYDKNAAAWLRELIKRGLITNGEVDERSVLEVQPEDLKGFTRHHFFAGIGVWDYALQGAGFPADRRVLTASTPCQPFSSAGAQKGKADERHLLPHFLELVLRCDMPLMFFEQVEAAIKHSWLDELHDSLPDYEVATSIIPAAAVGAPHIRSRLWAVATKNDTSRTIEQAVRNSFTAGERDLQAYAQRNQDTSGTHSGQNISGSEEISTTGLVDPAKLRDVRRPCEKCKQIRRQERPDVYEPVGSKCLPCRVSDTLRSGQQGQRELGQSVHSTADSDREADRTLNVGDSHDGCAISGLGNTSGTASERHTGGLHSSQGEVDGEDRLQDGSGSFGLTDASKAGSGLAQSDVMRLEGHELLETNVLAGRSQVSGLGNTEHQQHQGCVSGCGEELGADSGREAGESSRPSADSGLGNSGSHGHATDTLGRGTCEGEAKSGVCELEGSSTPTSVQPRYFIERETWSDNIIWLYCRDEKYRPVKSGIEPLAYGVADRMGRGGDNGVPFDANNTAEARAMRLKGYGNAINSVVAKTFIEAFLEAEQ